MKKELKKEYMHQRKTNTVLFHLYVEYNKQNKHTKQK